eukprot:CAMPEP_0115352612 /NCGR_PEP_ID=MMETSP0270-20121206/97598_1 /TAXON_ID=71861 /ORGANISM="Scrippsiella trochoidea, Strain CCMP3099" /LENGTH=49 /DNA_ID= /DNA_START= /DNA_END= /DNA_ORIENTATION=
MVAQPDACLVQLTQDQARHGPDESCKPAFPANVDAMQLQHMRQAWQQHR